MKYKNLFFIVFVIFLIGCQQQVDEVSEDSPIEIVSGKPVVEYIDEDFNDNLDAALQELEEIGDI